MAVEFTRDLELSGRLAEWFWDFGVHRQAKYPNYAISTSEWLKIVYEVKKELATVAEARKAQRPCVAIWGPSQTGKSTLVSAYLDEKAEVKGVLGEDGVGSALHWDGGDPALFMDPVTIRRKKAAPGVNILNPFNNGKDASACLSRFVKGSITHQPGCYHVANPKYPIQVLLVTEKDLLHALARGFDSDCWGHAPNGHKQTWDVERLQEEILYFQSKFDATGQDGAVDRRAYEMLHDFCEVLDDLVFAGLKTYQGLGVAERKYRSALASILSEKSLICSVENAEQFICRVFWEECEPLTDYYRAMRDALMKYEKVWAGKTLHCDIQTAVLLLDMDVYDLLSNPGIIDPAAVGRKDPAKVGALVRGLGWKLDGDRILLGQHSDNKVFEGDLAKSFAIFQGLVWELVVPLNPTHLEDSPFLKYLESADLLDFPGVANVSPNPSTMVKCECPHRKKDEGAPVTAEQVQTPPRFDASAFFTQILKRGKTSSIVSTYAKRLTIDGFVIFQNIDGVPAVNSEQLQTGIMTWWRAMVPSYFQQHEGRRSPLPLNLGLLWWRRVFDEADLARPEFGKYAWIWKNLGKLGDPKIVTTFALNYYGLPRGTPDYTRRDEKALEVLIRQIQKDDAFKEQFSNDVSQASFEQMFNDKRTGGANYFFGQLLRQVQDLHTKGDFNRQKILDGKCEANSSRIQGLLDERNLFPPPEERDIRKENLTTFKTFLDLQIQKGRFPESKMRALNYALRVFLNVHQDDLNPVPTNPHEVNEQYILDQYQRWINCQVERVRKTSAASDGGGKSVEWNLIGVNGEANCREYLGALVSSVVPEQLKAMAHWLVGLVKYANAHAQGRVDYRPYLATRMANEILYGQTGIPTFDGAMEEEMAAELEEETSFMFTGKACPSYQILVKDFLERRLPELINQKVKGQTVPQDLPGVQELKQLCQQYGRVPQIYATE